MGMSILYSLDSIIECINLSMRYILVLCNTLLNATHAQVIPSHLRVVINSFVDLVYLLAAFSEN